MDGYARQALLALVREEAKHSHVALATREEAVYFGAYRPTIKQVVSAASKVQPLPVPIQEAPKVEVAPPPPPPLPKPKPTSDLRTAVQKALPHIALRNTAPDDALAKKMARLWEAPYLEAKLVLIVFNETGPALEFLHNVVEAIDKLLAPARLIHGETYGEEWSLVLNAPLLHTLLISPWSYWKNSPLSRYYRQNGASGDHFLGKRQLLFLEPASHYLTSPELKRKLWKDLNMRLSS